MYNRSGLPMYYGASAKLFGFAQKMRDAPTEAEAVVWQLLNNVPFKQYRFRRQHPISTFIADFYSHGLRLVVEIDGGYHLNKEQADFDNFRDEDMTTLDISVLRFTNKEVMTRIDFISTQILKHINKSAE